MMIGFKDLIEPMTLGNMRANGVRSLDVSCWNCHHRAIMATSAPYSAAALVVTCKAAAASVKVSHSPSFSADR
jgi:ribosomal protein S27E